VARRIGRRQTGSLPHASGYYSLGVVAATAAQTTASLTGFGTGFIIPARIGRHGFGGRTGSSGVTAEVGKNGSPILTHRIGGNCSDTLLILTASVF
ncbi:MAG TPA: hypothetical protein VHB77_11635, partial [Planctomycetaceae bacterium]|nr:hypothetical protein [Planctomycetaceae bacterium]